MREPLPGFQASGADVLLKLGGSLLGDMERCRALATALGDLAREQRVVVFPGGGPIDNYIEELDRDLNFAPWTHHRLCARAQDQTGLIFGSLLENRGFFDTPVELPPVLDAGRLAVMLPARMIVELDVFEQSWRITSDTMSAFFADLFGARRFAILTNVDGVYRDPERRDEGPLPRIAASELACWGRTSVDECLSPFLLRQGMACSVLDGFDTAAVVDWVRTGACRGTEIVPE